MIKAANIMGPSPEPAPQGTQTRLRYIAFMDILGFKDLVLGEPSLERFRCKYQDIFFPSQNAVLNQNIEYRLFSDSLVVGVHHCTPDQEIVNLLNFCSEFLSTTLRMHFPIRGTIAFGNVLWDEHVVVGPPIIEAVQYEQSQEWIGIMLAPSTTRQLASNPSLLSFVQERLVHYEVPAKAAADQHARMAALCVIPAFRTKHDLEELSAALEQIGLQGGSAAATQKAQHTRDFLRYLRKLRFSGSAPKA